MEKQASQRLTSSFPQKGLAAVFRREASIRAFQPSASHMGVICTHSIKQSDTDSSSTGLVIPK